MDRIHDLVSDRRWLIVTGLVFGGALLGPLAAGGMILCTIALAAGYDSGIRKGDKRKDKPDCESTVEEKPDARKRDDNDRFGVAVYNRLGHLEQMFDTVDKAAEFYGCSRGAVYVRLDRGRFGGDFWVKVMPGEKARIKDDSLYMPEGEAKIPGLTDENDIITAAPMKSGCWIRGYRPEDGLIQDFRSISEAMRSTGCGECARQLSEGYVKDGWRFIVVRESGSDADLIGKQN